MTLLYRPTGEGRDGAIPRGCKLGGRTVPGGVAVALPAGPA